MISVHLRRFNRLIGLGSAMLAVVLLITAAGPAHQPTPNMTPATLRLGLFTRTLPMLAAQAKGFYAEQNLTVQYLQVASSPQQFQSLRDGEYDLGMTSPDNVANYRLNPNNPLGQTLDVQMMMGSDYATNLALVARPGINSLADLRGKNIAVDSPSSGFAFVLYKLMRQQGMERGVDYNVVVSGATPVRYNNLIAGKFDATMLNGGFETRAANVGYNLLGSAYDVVDPYLGTVTMATREWLDRNPDLAVRFIAAFAKATDWSLDPANREEAIQLLMTQANTPRGLAEQLYEIQVKPGVGVIADVTVDRKGLLNVLTLRDEFGGFETPQNLHYLTTPASDLYDLSFYRAARQYANVTK